jgi:glyoxylase-like metal-dependent hydrolase (beta-lactamase superfamily II)
MRIENTVITTSDANPPMSNGASPQSKWWEDHPHRIYQTLTRITTDHPWFQVYRIHDWLYVIYEDGIFDEPVMYLLIGDDKAALIDSGSGIGRIDRVVRELTGKRCLLILTHTHNDHIGGCRYFDEIAVYDDVMSRERSAKGYDKAKMGEIIEGENVIKKFPAEFDPGAYYAPPFRVTRWLHDGDVVDLGGHRLEVIHTPGHSSNHICLLDRGTRYLWTGDHFYLGGISTYLPGGDHNDFIESCRRLVGLMSDYDKLLPAHNQPLVDKAAMMELLYASEEIKAGNSKNYTERMAVAADYNKPVRRYQYRGFSLTTDLKP